MYSLVIVNAVDDDDENAYGGLAEEGEPISCRPFQSQFHAHICIDGNNKSTSSCNACEMSSEWSKINKLMNN